jgi:hypothetical protein
MGVATTLLLLAAPIEHRQARDCEVPQQTEKWAKVIRVANIKAE